MTALAASPSISVNRTAVTSPKSAIDFGRYVSLMDESGNWRQVPQETLTCVPFCPVMKITPKVAGAILGNRNMQNRSIERRRVQRYISDIVTGQWKVTGDTIKFNRQGSLIDGQHRLQAVMESGKDANFTVAFGVDDDAVIAIDEGKPRTNLDVARIIGMEGVSKYAMSIAAYTLEHAGVKHKRTRSDIIEFFQRHEEAINFVADRFSSQAVIKAPIGVVLFRAFYHFRYDQKRLDRLARFMELLQLKSSDLINQNIPDTDNAPLTLREFVLRSAGKNTGSFRRELYEKTESALWSFMNNQPIGKLYGFSRERFPLPEEISGSGL